MAPRTTPDLAEADAGTGPQSRHQLRDVGEVGADFGVTAVVRITLTLADGREIVADLPSPQTVKDWTATKAGQAIIEVLAREGRPLKGSAIAAHAKYAYNGSFRSALKGLVLQGEIGHDEDDGYELVG